MTCRESLRAVSLLATLGVVPMLAALPGASTVLAQAPTCLEGYVLDAITGAPLAGARVRPVRQGGEARTDASGRFCLRGISDGDVQVRVEAEGYATSVEQVPVWPGRTTVARFQLVPMAAALEALIVTAQPHDPEERERGESVGRVEAREVELSASSSVSELLSGRVPGASVMRASGQVGGGTRILLRGVSSIALSNDPIIFLDGVRVSNAVTQGTGRGALTVTVLDVVDPSSIERIEVLRGPAAAMRYGPDTSSGVILIYTKRGSPPQRRPRERSGLPREPTHP